MTSAIATEDVLISGLVIVCYTTKQIPNLLHYREAAFIAELHRTLWRKFCM